MSDAGRLVDSRSRMEAVERLCTPQTSSGSDCLWAASHATASCDFFVDLFGNKASVSNTTEKQNSSTDFGLTAEQTLWLVRQYLPTLYICQYSYFPSSYRPPTMERLSTSSKNERHVSLAVLKFSARRYSKEIAELWARLNQIVLRREDVFRKRWNKKKEAQRRTVLLNSWPGMPERHRPDLKEIFSKSNRAGNHDEGVFKWPHINLEDLLPVHSLPLLLNSRARNLPHVFAHADAESVRLGLQLHRIQKTVIKGEEYIYVMFLAGPPTAQTYGQLIPVKREEVDRYNKERFRHHLPAQGILVLEIQSKILRFLLQCCKQVFHDLSDEELPGHQLLVLPVTDIVTRAEASGALLANLVAEAPYRVPANLDTSHVLHLIDAAKSTAEHHLWDLREDPGFFSTTILEFSPVSSGCSLALPGTSVPREDADSWRDYIIRSIVHAHNALIAWDVLHELAKSLDATAPGLLDSLDYTQRLPASIEETLVRMVRALDCLGHRQSHDLLYSLNATGFGEALTERWENDTIFTQTIRQKGRPVSDALLDLFAKFGDFESEWTHKVGMSNLIDEIQHLLDAHPSERRRLSPYTQRVFDELAVGSRLMGQLLSFFPWAADFQKLASGLDFFGDNATHDAERMENAFKASNVDLQFALPVSKKLHYPIEKPRTASNVEALRSAEANLDAIWARVDQCFFKAEGETLLELFHRSACSRRELHRTPSDSAITTSGPQLEPRNLDEGSDVSTDLQTLNLGPESPRRWLREPVRAKVKTRGAPATPDDPSGHEANTSNPVSPAPLHRQTIAVKKSVYKVFSTLFYQVAVDEHRNLGEIPWTDFVRAMTAIGFAVDKLYGSVWQFTPSGGRIGSGKSIHFHEPHPSKKIPFIMARRFGRRLFRTYGLTGDTFELA